MPTGSDGGAQAPPAGGSPAASGQQAGPTARTNNSTGQGCSRHDRHGNRQSSGSARQNQTKFEGREPSLKGFIYDSTGERNPNQYIKMTKEIINYVSRTYTKYTAEFMQAVQDLKLVDPTPPVNPDPANPIVFEMWKLEVKEHRIKEQEYSNFRAGLYNIIFGQCTKALQDKLKSHINFLNAYQDRIVLLMIIKMLTYTFEERRKLADVLCEIKEMFYSFWQGKHMSLQCYHELFLGQVEVLEEVGMSIPDESLVESIAGQRC
jgi:hypothetical protein